MVAAVVNRAAADFPAPAMGAAAGQIEKLPTAKRAVAPVANPEVAGHFATGANQNNDDDLLDDLTRGKSNRITEIGKGWRLEDNSDGRLRWRWQVKDNAGNPITYVKSDGEIAYKRGSRYVGITQREEAREHDSKRVKGKHKRRRGGKARR